MTDESVSDLSLNRTECAHCGAVWINGQHYWRTGAMGNEADLASLVCQPYGDSQCINPQREAEGGDTWKKRSKDLDKTTEEFRTS